MESILNAKRLSDVKKKSITFVLSQRKGRDFPGYPVSSIIPSDCTILWTPEENGIPQPEKAYERLIRYRAGMKSIFVDEWSEYEKKEYKRGSTITFFIGFKTIPTTEKNLLLFLRLSGNNQANDNVRMSGTSVLYKEVDYEVNDEKRVQSERLTTQAMYFVNEAPIDDVKSYAQSLCTKKNQIDTLNSMSEVSIRASLIGLAKTKPETFIEGLQSPDIKNKVFIIQAIYKGIIKIDKDYTQLSWKSGDVFVESPKGVDVITWFAEMTIKNDKYGAILDSVKELLNSANVQNQKFGVKKEDNDVVEKETRDSTWQEKLIKDALAEGVLVKKGTWFKIKGEDGEELYSEQGMRTLLIDLADKKSPLLDYLMKRN